MAAQMWSLYLMHQVEKAALERRTWLNVMDGVSQIKMLYLSKFLYKIIKTCCPIIGLEC